MDFRILKKMIFSDGFVRFELKEFFDFKEQIDTLKLPTLSKLTEFYAHDVEFKRHELDDLGNEISIIIKKIQNPIVFKLLNELQSLIKQSKEENKSIFVLTE